MRDQNLRQHEKVGLKLLRLARKTQLIQHISAKNEHQQRELFLANDIENPKFVWKRPMYSTKKLKKDLDKLRIPDDELKPIYDGIIKRVRLKNTLIENLGDAKITKEVSEILFGRPSAEIVEKAKGISFKLSKEISENGKEEKEYDSSEVVRIANRFLGKAGLKWRAKEKNRVSVSINSRRRELKISSQKKYSAKRIHGLIVHEILAHVFRSENGNLQPLPVFRIRWPKYLATGEGLAMYLEEKYKAASPESSLRHALKVIAVDSAYKDMSFREVFNRMKSFGIEDLLAWELTYRVFRGGGFLKDHVYLQGYFMIKDFIKGGGDINNLYFGRIALEDIGTCKALVERGLMNPPEYLPDFSLLDHLEIEKLAYTAL